MRQRTAGLVRRSLGEGGVTIVEVTAAITIVGIVISLLIPACSRSARFDKVLACQGNLKSLHQAQRKAAPPGPDEFGSAYWVRLTKTSPPLVAASALRCPLQGAPESPACHYLGPSKDPAGADAKDPIGCDLPHNHSADEKQGGNVLMKSGEVVTDHTGIWGGALRQGKCRP